MSYPLENTTLQFRPNSLGLNAAAPLSRRELRKAIDRIFPLASEFDAFLIDFFPAVYRQISVGMDRTSRINLLFQMTSESELSLRLRQEFPAEVAQAEIASTVASSLGYTPQRIRYTVVLVAHIDDLDPVKLKALIEQLRNYTCDSELTIEAIRKGSVILVCEGSESGFAKLFEDFSIGKLKDLLGFLLADVVLNVPSVAAPATDAVTTGLTTVFGSWSRNGGLSNRQPPLRTAQTTQTTRTFATVDNSPARPGAPAKPVVRLPLSRLLSFGALGAVLCCLALLLLSLSRVQYAPRRQWDSSRDDPQGASGAFAVRASPPLPSEPQAPQGYSDDPVAKSALPAPPRPASSPKPSRAKSLTHSKPAALDPEFQISGADGAAKKAVLACAVAHIQPLRLPAGTLLAFDRIASRWFLLPGPSTVTNRDLRDAMNTCLHNELSKLAPKSPPKSVRIWVVRKPI